MADDPKQIKITRSDFAEKFLHLNGSPFSLDDYPHMRQIYNSSAKNVVLMFSRQTAKSTSLANILITNSAMVPYFKTLYIAPTVDQTKVFSHDRVNPVIEGSPIIRDYYINTSLVQNVFMKQFLNGSRMYLRYALLSADRIRGYSADMNLFDEVQDLREDVIPVIQETMSRSEHKITWYCGTPKRTRGTLAGLWRRSNQCEYMVKCTCNYWNKLGDENIGNTGLICSKCGTDIDVSTSKGQWVSHQADGVPIEMEGYRVCLLHFAKSPWVEWDRDVIQKRKNTSKGIFYNETLGLEYDEGVTPVTEGELIGCCDSNFTMTDEPDKHARGYHSIMGIDYGPVNSSRSNTVIVIVQQRGNTTRVVYMKKFLGKEADFAYIHRVVPELFKKWRCLSIASDYGMGESANSEIRSRIGYEKLIAFQHLPNQKETVRWNSKMPAYTLNRSQVLDDLFSKIRKQKIVFPRWEDTKQFAEDFLNMQIEYDEERNTVKYINIGPDDAVHATLFATVSLEMQQGMARFN